MIVMAFNVIIFVHELGHFLAAKWRGLQIDRFQIWFGKPLWKKEINGVQYGFGWIPAGGFVALPQMAPMEAIEGGEKPEKPLPSISPMDKIIVAFAGPLFSMLLALASAVIVWQVGKPKDFVPTQIVGFVDEKSPAEKAGFKVGDKIEQINGKPVNGWAGTLDSIFENIVLSAGSEIEFKVRREGVPDLLTIRSGYETPPAKWYQRRALRRVGIGPQAEDLVVTSVYEGSPADKAGIEEEDELVSMDGKVFTKSDEAVNYIRSAGETPIQMLLLRDKKEISVSVQAVKPVEPKGEKPMVGVALEEVPMQDTRIVHPKPVEQVSDSLRMMWTTLVKLVTPSSSIGVDHLSGPIGIARVQYKLIQMEDGWRRILAFLVLFNVNLAVLNMLPFPVLDGGHITLAILEKLRGRPVKSKPLEILQTACALLLISLMLFVSSKDIGDDFGRGENQPKKLVFPE